MGPSEDFELEVSPEYKVEEADKAEGKIDVTFTKFKGTQQFNFLGKPITFFISINKLDKNTVVTLNQKKASDKTDRRQLRIIANKEEYYFNINMECIDNLI